MKGRRSACSRQRARGNGRVDALGQGDRGKAKDSIAGCSQSPGADGADAERISKECRDARYERDECQSVLHAYRGSLGLPMSGYAVGLPVSASQGEGLLQE
jgi:hypothetical protein